VDKVKKSEA